VTGTQVAARVMALCLDQSGHLPDSDYAAMAARGGLLVDLALARRLTQTDDSIELDSTPTGWPPTDQALSELALLDGRSLDWWLEHSRVQLHDLAAALVAEGTWTRLPARPLHRKPRYAVRGTGTLTRDQALLAQPHLGATNADAALIAIAVAAGLAKEQPAFLTSEDLLGRMEPVAWVCRLTADFISRARIDGSAASSASRTALWSELPF
jgi:Golgi phosphoprotein 3 (GPP34)